MKKLIKSVIVAGLLLTGATANQVEAAKVSYVKGTLTGWADSNSFEVKTTKKKYVVMRTSNKWYYKNLKEGKQYTYYYYKNKHGQYIITKINK